MSPILAILVASITIGAIGTTYVAYDAGYVPIKEFMTTEEPIGYERVCGDCVLNQLGDYKNIIDEMPNLKNIKYEFYISTANYLEIIEDYTTRLTKAGYTLEVEGSKTINDINLRYIGFVEGITAVGIVIASGDELGYPEAESLLLYTTGNVIDYQAIYDWYINGSDG